MSAIIGEKDLVSEVVEATIWMNSQLLVPYLGRAWIELLKSVLSRSSNGHSFRCGCFCSHAVDMFQL